MLLPGHGGAVAEPRRTVKAYLLHRRWREQAILEAVRKGTNTVRKLLPVIYRDLDKDGGRRGDAVAARAHRAPGRARAYRLRRLRERRLRCCSSLTLGFASSASLPRAAGTTNSMPHDDVFEELADALGVAAEIVRAVARGRAHVDAARARSLPATRITTSS